METVDDQLARKMAYLIVACSVFLFLSMFLESVGVYFRCVGSVCGEPAMGYSTHVRIATIGRFFVFGGAPTLGYLVDNGALAVDVSALGALCFLTFFSSLIFFMRFGHFSIFFSTYSLVNRSNLSKTELDDQRVFRWCRENNHGIVVLSSLSFSLTGVGVIVVNLLASLFPDSRAMLVQFSAAVTMLGTLVHVLYVDPALSRAADKSFTDVLDVANQFILGRLISSCMLSVFFGGMVIYFGRS